MKLESNTKRLVVGIILIIALASLCVYYSNHYEEHLKYPSYRAILSDYPQDEVVNIGGTVTQVGADKFYLKDNYHGHTITMEVLTNNSKSKNTNKYTPISIKTPISVNDRISVVGVLGSHYQIVKVLHMDMTENWNYIFLLLRSFLALLFLVYIFNHYWRFDLKYFEFRRR